MEIEIGENRAIKVNQLLCSAKHKSKNLIEIKMNYTLL